MLIPLACFALGFGMLRSPDFWLELFRTARTETGRRINRRLITKGTVKYQAIIMLGAGGIFTFISVMTILNR